MKKIGFNCERVLSDKFFLPKEVSAELRQVVKTVHECLSHVVI